MRAHVAAAGSMSPMYDPFQGKANAYDDERTRADRRVRSRNGRICAQELLEQGPNHCFVHDRPVRQADLPDYRQRAWRS
jgi:hypothetical protein